MPSSHATPVRARVHVSGTVQGVGFRYFTLHAARELGLVGWVRNVSTGSVEAEVEGPDDKVTAFIEVMRRGPSSSVVRELHSQRIPPMGDTSFDIRT